MLWIETAAEHGIKWHYKWQNLQLTIIVLIISFTIGIFFFCLQKDFVFSCKNIALSKCTNVAVFANEIMKKIWRYCIEKQKCHISNDFFFYFFYQSSSKFVCGTNSLKLISPCSNNLISLNFKTDNTSTYSCILLISCWVRLCHLIKMYD